MNRALNVAVDILPENRKNAISVTWETLVGADKEYPVQRGNCFSVKCDDGKEYRIVNFYHENLEHLLKEKMIEWPIQIVVLEGKVAIIHDHRIEHRGYRSDFCTACCPQDLLPINQRLQIQREFESGRRTESECEIMGEKVIMVKYTMEPTTRKMKEGWTITEEIGDPIINAPYFPILNRVEGDINE